MRCDAGVVFFVCEVFGISKDVVFEVSVVVCESGVNFRGGIGDGIECAVAGRGLGMVSDIVGWRWSYVGLYGRLLGAGLLRGGVLGINHCIQ